MLSIITRQPSSGTENFEAQYNLGAIYMRQQKNGRRRQSLKKRIASGRAIGSAGELRTFMRFQNQHESRSHLRRAGKGARPGFHLAKLGSTWPASPFEGAVPILEKAPESTKECGYLFPSRRLYGDLKRFEEAIAAYRKSIQINPKQKEVHYNLARCTQSRTGGRGENGLKIAVI